MRPRAWRITMWTSLAATVLLAGLAEWCRRGGYFGWVDSQGRGIALMNGALGNFDGQAGAGWVHGNHVGAYHGLWYWYPPNGMYDRVHFGFSLWVLPAATLGLAAFSAWRIHRARRPGHCPCGYNLSGLSKDARCPECGRMSHGAAHSGHRP